VNFNASNVYKITFYNSFLTSGVILGYIMYLSITLCTGELLQNFLFLYRTYFPGLEEKLSSIKFLQPYMPREAESESDSESGDFEHDDEEEDSDPARERQNPSVDLGNTVTSPGGNRTSRADSTGGALKANRSAKSQQDQQAILAAFVDMNPGMSFSAPQVLPPRKNRSGKEVRTPRTPRARGNTLEASSPSRDPSRADDDAELARDIAAGLSGEV